MLGTSGDEVAADAAAEAATAVAATAPDSPHRPDLGGGVVPSVTAPSLVTDTDPSDRCPERRAIHLTATAVHLPEDASQTVPRPSESLAQSVLSHHKLTLTDVVPHSSALPPAPNDSSSGKQQSYSQTLKPARAPTPLSSEQIRVTQRSNSPSPTSSFGLVHTTTTAAFGTVDKSDDCFLEPLEALIGSSTAGKPASLLPDAPPSSPSSPKIDSIPIADPPPPSPTRQFVTAISRLYGDKDAVEAGKSNPEDPPDYEISARCFLDDPVLVVGDIVGNGSRAEQEAATEAATTALGTNPNLEKDDDIRHALISQYFPEPNNSLADCIEASASDCGVDDDDAPSTPSLPPPSPNSIFSANSGSSHNEMSSLPTSSTPHQSSHSSPIPNPPPFFDGNPQQHLFPSAPSSGVVGEAGPYDQGPASSFAPHSVSIGQIGASKPTKLASQRLSMTPLDAFSSNATPLSSSRSSPVRSPPQIFPSSESNTVWADRNLRISTTGGSGRPLSFPGFSPSQSLFMWVLAQQHTGGHSHHLSWLDPHVHSPKSMVRERLAKADAYDLNVEASAAVTNSAGDADDLSVETVESQHADRDLFPSDFDSKANSPQSTAMPPEGSEEARISLLSSRSIEIGDPSSFLDPTQLQLSHSPPAQDLHSLQVLSERQDLTEDADVPGDGQDLETLKRPPILYNPVPPTEDLDASAVRLPSSVVKVLDVIARDSNEAEHLPDVSERASSAVKADVAGSALYSVLLKSQSVDQEDSSSTSDTDGEWHSNASSSAVLTENAADVHSTVGEVGVNEESSPLAPEASLNENEESLPTRSFFEYFPQNDPALPSLEAKVLALSLRKSGFLQRLNIAPGRRDAEVDDSQNTAGSGLSRSFSTLWKNRRTATVVDSQRVKSSTRANAVTGRQSPSVRGTSPALEEDDQSNHVVVRSMSQASFQSQQTDLSATSTKVVVNSGGGSGSMGVLGIADSAASFSSSALDWTTYYVEVRGHYMIFYSFQEWGFGVDSLAPFPNSQGKHRPFGTTLDEPQKSEPGLAQTAVAAPSKGWRIGQRPVTPNRDQRNGEERRGSPISGESSSSGLNKIMESMSFSKKPKRRISVFTPATAGRDSPSPIPSKLPHDSMEARSLPRYEDRKLIHYIDLAGTSIELLPPRGPSIVTATTNIVRLTLGNEAILLNMYEGEFSAAESIPIQFPNSFAKDSGSTDWISVLNSVRSKPPLPTLSSQYGSQTSPPKRRPSFISISSKPPESDPQSIASQQFAPEEHLKRSESPLSTPATTSKQSIARLFTSKRKASADGVASDYARSSPIPPSPLQQSTGSYFPSVATSAFGNVGFVEGATPVGTSNNHPQSQMGFHLKPRARGVLTAKSRLSPLLSAPASQDSASIPLDSVVDISSSRIESKESGSVVPLVTGSPVSSKSSPNTGSEPSSESYYHRLGPASSADSSPPQNRNVGSNNTATKLLPIFLGRGGRKPVNGNVPEHTNPAVSSYPPPPIPSNGGEVSTHLSHSPLSPPKAGFSVTRPKQRNSGTIGGATAAVSFPGGGSIGVSPIAMHTPSGVPSSGAADGVVMKRSSTVGSRRMGSFNPKGRSRLVGERPVSVAASWQVPGTSVQRRSERIIQMEDDEEVPILLRKCIELIEAIGLDTEGLYRVSGSAVSQAKLKRLLTADPARVQLMPPRPTTRLDSPTASSPVDFVLPSINPSANALRLKQRGSRLSLSESRATDNDEVITPHCLTWLLMVL
ncbi:hypothetical protein DFJ73DRAFT_473731 [Zopfochytrium polystomum]|nr:hypothetical protein DFJ73DRAFT_473731 [Zopfochytrium polystomum]